MFRELIRSHLALSQEECAEILKNERRGVLAVHGDDGYPYAMPMNHYYNEEDGHIYFHGGMEGHKIDSIKANAKVSYCVFDQGAPNANTWALTVKSVIVFGHAKIVEDQEKAMAMTRKLCYKFTDDEEYINGEFERSAFRTLCFEIVPDHISGKRVLES